jgi:hypothetical protein
MKRSTVPAALITMALAAAGCGGGGGGTAGGGVGAGGQPTTAAAGSASVADYRSQVLAILGDTGTAQEAFTKALGSDNGSLKVVGPAAGRYAEARDAAARRLSSLEAPSASAQPQQDLIAAFTAETAGLRALQAAAQSGDRTATRAALDAYKPLSQDVATKIKALLDSLR